MRYIALILTILITTAAFATENVEISDDAKMIVAYLHMEKGHKAMKSDNTILAEREFSLAIISDFSKLTLYLYRAEARFRLGKYKEVISDLNIYLESNSDDSRAFIIRGLAKSLLDPENVSGSCADMLIVEKLGEDINLLNGIEKYCKGQSGWDDR